MRVEIRLCSPYPLKAEECHDECLASDYLVLHQACFTVDLLTNRPSYSGKYSFRSWPDEPSSVVVPSGGVHTCEMHCRSTSEADGYVELDVHDCRALIQLLLIRTNRSVFVTPHTVARSIRCFPETQIQINTVVRGVVRYIIIIPVRIFCYC